MSCDRKNDCGTTLLHCLLLSSGLPLFGQVSTHEARDVLSATSIVQNPDFALADAVPVYSWYTIHIYIYTYVYVYIDIDICRYICPYSPYVTVVQQPLIVPLPPGRPPLSEAK